MKKLMIGLVGAMAMVASAQAEIASENVVGYDTQNIAAGNFNMFSVPFKMTGGNGFSLNKNISLKNATAADNSADADQIQIWNPQTNGYQTWYLYDDGEGGYDEGWYRVSNDEEWFDDFYPEGLPAGTAFWYLAKDSSTEAEICFCGEVSEASSTFTLVKGNFNMLANPYPQAFSLNKNLVLTGATAADNSADADQIQIWNPQTNGYQTWYLYDDGEGGYDEGWYRVSNDEEWFDDFYPEGLPAGTAFWYLAASGSGEITATFTK